MTVKSKDPKPSQDIPKNVSGDDFFLQHKVHESEIPSKSLIQTKEGSLFGSILKGVFRRSQSFLSSRVKGQSDQ